MALTPAVLEQLRAEAALARARGKAALEAERVAQQKAQAKRKKR